MADNLLMVISTKRYVLIAARHGNGKVEKIPLDRSNQTAINVKSDQCLVGIYSEYDQNKHGIYTITLPNDFLKENPPNFIYSQF